MKKLSEVEFKERTEEILKAKKIFVPHVTSNITIAFEIYQRLLADKPMDVQITSKREVSDKANVVGEKCPECGTLMYLSYVARDSEGKNWPSSWKCPKCLAEYYSEKPVEDWLDEIRTQQIKQIKEQHK